MGNAVAGDDSAEGARHGLNGNRIIDQGPERLEGGGPHCSIAMAPSWGDGTWGVSTIESMGMKTPQTG